MNNKHLTFEERSIIEGLLNKGENIHKIAQKIVILTAPGRRECHNGFRR